MIGSRRTLANCVLLCFLAFTSPVNAEDVEEFRVLGGAGDITNASMCKTGHYIVGFKGRTGAWIDQIRIRCAPLLDGGGVGSSKAEGGAGGNGGGDDPGEKCGKGNIVNRIKFYLTKENRQVEYIEFWCIDPDDRSEEGVRHGFGNPHGNRAGQRATQPCSEGFAASGLNHRWGAHLNAIGLICKYMRRP